LTPASRDLAAAGGGGRCNDVTSAAGFSRNKSPAPQIEMSNRRPAVVAALSHYFSPPLCHSDAAAAARWIACRIQFQSECMYTFCELQTGLRVVHGLG